MDCSTDTEELRRYERQKKKSRVQYPKQVDFKLIGSTSWIDHNPECHAGAFEHGVEDPGLHVPQHVPMASSRKCTKWTSIEEAVCICLIHQGQGQVRSGQACRHSTGGNCRPSCALAQGSSGFGAVAQQSQSATGSSGCCHIISIKYQTSHL